MATEIIMPKAGMSMETGTIIQWFKKPGEYVEAGEALLEIETDKVAMEVEAEVSGYLLKIIHDAGDEVEVVKPIGYIGEKDEMLPESGETVSSQSSIENSSGSGITTTDRDESGALPSPAAAKQQSVPERRTAATPAARRRAGELAISIDEIEATGHWNEVRLRDVERFIEAGGSVKIPASGQRISISPIAKDLAERDNIDLTTIEGSGIGGRVLKQDVEQQGRQTTSAPGPATQPNEQVRRSPLRGMRKVIAERMSLSHQTIPAVTLNRKVNASALFDLRKNLNEEMQPRISVNDFIVKAVAKILKMAPYMRTAIDGNELVENQEINIGIAVALEEGLLVPVVKKVDTMTLSELSDRSKDLARRARERKLEPDELQGGSFTVTNLGMFGISSFTPIINLPQSAILGVNAAEDELYLDNGEVRSKKVMTLSLTIDHRVIDGAQGAVFLNDLAQLIEAPLKILI